MTIENAKEAIKLNTEKERLNNMLVSLNRFSDETTTLKVTTSNGSRQLCNNAYIEDVETIKLVIGLISGYYLKEISKLEKMIEEL